jgi:AcrR family transcriptional regulator
MMAITVPTPSTLNERGGVTSRTNQRATAAPPRRDPDATLQRILDRAVARFDEHGAPGIVVTAIAREAGVSVGALYHYFSGRAGLLAAARAEQFVRTTEADITELRRGLADASSFDEFLELNYSLVRRNRQPDRVRARRERLSALAAGEVDPETSFSVQEAQRRLTDALVAGVEQARARGWFADDVDARAWVVMMQGLMLGAVIADLDSQVDDEQWITLVQRVQDLAIRPSERDGR